MASSNSDSLIVVSQSDVEREIVRLFGDSVHTGLIIRVQGAEAGDDSRSEAFRELLDSLTMYDFHGGQQHITVEAPDQQTIAAALAVLGEPRVKRRLFERVLLTFGKHIVDPLGKILDATPGGALLARMSSMRDNLMGWITQLRLTHETQELLMGDLKRLLSDNYLAELAEMEENIQRPRVTELAKEVLHLIGSTFERAFRHWPDHAQTIADSVNRRMSTKMSLRESPGVIRLRIIEGLEEYLWIETSMELTGAVSQLFQQPQYRGLTAEGPPELARELYRQFAESCWDIISENC